MHRITFFTGDSKARQYEANALDVDFYVEYHFNHYARTSSYTLVRVPVPPKQKSLAFAKMHANLVHQVFDIPLYDKVMDDPELNMAGNHKGVLFCKRGSRDANSFMMADAPSVLIEPMFLSNPEHVDILLNADGQRKLAHILAHSIRETFPERAHIGFSVGHKYQRGLPMDRGCCAVNHPEFTEADFADNIMREAAFMLEHGVETMSLPSI